jgi:hypothetical protein
MSESRPTAQELGAMTVNERLVVCGLIDAWDQAVQRRDRDGMITILREVALSDRQAQQTADAVLKDPRRCGF